MNAKTILGYALAFGVGAAPGFFLILNSLFSDGGSLTERVLTFVATVVVYGMLGALFGHFGAERPWRWAVLLTLPAALMGGFLIRHEPQVILLGLGYLAVAGLSASAGSVLAARLSGTRRV